MWSRRVRKGALKIDSRCQSVRPSVRTRRVSTSTSHCETSGRNDRQQYVLRATDGRTNKQTKQTDGQPRYVLQLPLTVAVIVTIAALLVAILH